IDHFFAFAELVFVVEVGNVDHAFQVVGLGQSADNFVDFVADFFVVFGGDHVVEAGTGGHVDHAVGIVFGFVGDVLPTQQGEYVIFVLRGIHAAAQFIAAGPEG